MKKLNKKGFTIVELVIVIAVIAILAAVLIPTFATVIDKANKNAALQAARNEYTEYMANFEYTAASTPATDLIIKGNDFYFAIVNGEMKTTAYSGTAEAAIVEFTNKALGSEAVAGKVWMVVDSQP